MTSSKEKTSGFQKWGFYQMIMAFKRDTVRNDIVLDLDMHEYA